MTNQEYSKAGASDRGYALANAVSSRKLEVDKYQYEFAMDSRAGCLELFRTTEDSDISCSVYCTPEYERSPENEKCFLQYGDGDVESGSNIMEMKFWTSRDLQLDIDSFMQYATITIVPFLEMCIENAINLKKFRGIPAAPLQRIVRESDSNNNIGIKAVYNVLAHYIEYTNDIKDIETKDWLNTALVSHITSATDLPKEFVAKIVGIITNSYSL